MTSRPQKTWLALTSWRHVWHHSEVRLSIKDRTNNRWEQRIEKDCWCLNTYVFMVLAIYGGRILQVRGLVYGTGSKGSTFRKVLNWNSLRWLGHVLCRPTKRMYRCMPSFEEDNNWKTVRGGQWMTLKKVWKLQPVNWGQWHFNERFSAQIINDCAAPFEFTSF